MSRRQRLRWIVRVTMLGIFLIVLLGMETSMAGETGSQKPLFIGVHHVGLYTGNQTDALSLAKWYEKNFGFKFTGTGLSYITNQSVSGNLEFMKTDPEVKGHLAIEVSNFEEARKDLEGKGLQLGPTLYVGPMLVAYIKGTDPAGYRVHLFYIKK